MGLRLQKHVVSILTNNLNIENAELLAKLIPARLKEIEEASTSNFYHLFNKLKQ